MTLKQLVPFSTILEKGLGMRYSARLALLACAGLVALGFSGAALAAFTPKLDISSKGPVAGGPGATIHVSLAPTDDPTAKVTIYAPPGYTADLSAAAGAELGKVSAKVTAADLGGVTLPLEGTVKAANPADFVGPPNNACVPGTHQAVWLLVLTAAGQTLQVPAYVDAAAGPEAAFSSYKIQICLPPPDIPPGTPGRATFGAKLFDATFSVNVYATPAAGEYRWRSLWTPYTPGKGTANPVGTVEAQSLVRSPVALTLAPKFDKKKRSATLTGSLTENGQGIGGVQLQLVAGKTATSLKPVGSATTGSDGSYTVTRKSVLQTTFFQTQATVAARDLGAAGCTATFAALGIQCVSAAIGEVTASSSVVKVNVPKAKKK